MVRDGGDGGGAVLVTVTRGAHLHQLVQFSVALIFPFSKGLFTPIKVEVFVSDDFHILTLCVNSI